MKLIDFQFFISVTDILYIFVDSFIYNQQLSLEEFFFFYISVFLAYMNRNHLNLQVKIF